MFSEFCSATRKHGLKHLNPTWTEKLYPCFVFKDIVVVFQSQGAITEKLRSFSMHDLTSIQGDEPVGQRACQPLPEAKKKTRASASESSGKYLFFIAKRTIHQGQKWESREIHLPHWGRVLVHLNTIDLNKIWHLKNTPWIIFFLQPLIVWSYCTHYSYLCQLAMTIPCQSKA